MNVLLDECVPWPIRRVLAGHACQSVPRLGWAGIKNGRLLALADPAFDLFITSDQGIAYQQNPSGRRIAVLELSTNNLRRLQAAADLIRAEVATIRPGEFRAVAIP